MRAACTGARSARSTTTTATGPRTRWPTRRSSWSRRGSSRGTPPVVATLDYLEQAKVPMLFPFQSSTATRSKKYVFSGLVLSDRQSHMMIDYLAGPRKFKRSAALYQDDEYGKSFLTAFEADLGRHGLKLAATEPVKRGVTDVSAQIAKLQVGRPEVTLLVLTPGPAAQALKEIGR